MGNDGRIQSRFPLGNPSLWKVWRARLLWMTGLRESLDSCGYGRALHTIQQVCTGRIAMPVGDVGNRGRVIEAISGFCKTPDTHNRDLENRAGCQPQSVEGLRRDFHFSCVNYGYYCLFFYSFSSLNTPSRYESRQPLAGRNWCPKRARFVGAIESLSSTGEGWWEWNSADQAWSEGLFEWAQISAIVDRFSTHS
jgi:hypothetical protein